MNTGKIQTSELDALNSAKRQRKSAAADFGAELAQAATQPTQLTGPKVLSPLYSSDFTAGNSLLPDKPNQLKPMTVGDLGHLLPAANLRPLDPDEPIVGSKSEPTDRHTQLVKQSEKLVAQTFYGTMLKQMRESPFKSEIFSGGRAGQAFSSMLDQRLADHMAHGAGGKLVKSLVKSIERKNPDHASASLPQIAKTGSDPVSLNSFKNVRVHVAPSLGN